MEDITSLFNYRDPRSMMADSYASQYQQLSGTPQQMIIQNAANAGSLMGNALFGGKTSAMAEQSVLNEAIKESEVAEDPDERLKLFAAALRKRGLEGYAQKAEKQLLDRQKTLSDINKNKADSEMKQVAYANRFAALTSQFSEMKPEVARGLALSETSFNDFMKDKQIKYSNTVEEISKELYNKPFTLLTSDEAKAVNLLKEQREGSKAAKGAVRVTVNGKEEESEFGKQLGKVQATRLGAAYDKRDAALRELSTFEQLATLPDNQLISGSLAEPRIEIANFLDTAGLASKADAAKVAASQQFQKLSNDLVLARVKQLGYNPSDADRKFIEQTIPRLSSSAAARKQLMAFMAKVARDVSDEVSSMETYATENKTLTGYKPKIPQVSMGAPTKSVSSMTDEELLKALQNSKK